jgi:transcriptional regulator with XRE-family HTH domain
MAPLKEVRSKKLMTMRELATAAGVALSTLYQIESGNSTPSLRVVRQLSTALGVEPETVDEFAAAIEASGQGKAVPLAA